MRPIPTPIEISHFMTWHALKNEFAQNTILYSIEKDVWFMLAELRDCHLIRPLISLTRAHIQTHTTRSVNLIPWKLARVNKGCSQVCQNM